MGQDKFIRLKEIMLYSFGVLFFIDESIARHILSFMAFLLVVDIFYYKNKLDCGNKKLKYCILVFIVAGLLWNYMADFNYRAARAFLKINRDFFLVFYIYMLYKQKKESCKFYFISLFVGFLAFMIKTFIYIYKSGIENIGRYRLNSYLGDISNTALLCSILTCFFFGLLLSEKTRKKEKIIYAIFMSITFIFMLLTLTRAAFLATLAGMVIIVLVNKNIKVIVTSFILLLLLSYGTIKNPHFSRIKENIFNTKVEKNNGSNGIRVLLWKNAIWRIKQHPIMGSGTKQDDKLFYEYVNNMPEGNPTEKSFKESLKNNFNDAHNMYLNGFADNGLFYIYSLSLLLVIMPYILLKNKDYKYRLPLLGALATVAIYGLVWSVWRVGWSCLAVWVLFSLVCYSYEEVTE